MLQLSGRCPIFIGHKIDGPLRRRIEALSGPDRRYVSAVDSTFLRVCRLGEDEYVGKVIHESISTERVDDVRRNVLSILQRLFPDVRFPAQLEVHCCEPPSEGENR